jgi:thiamine pyrophosphokinase
MPAQGEIGTFNHLPAQGRWFFVSMAQRAVILANGLMASDTKWPEILLPEDLLIAADGGARFFLAAETVPNYVIGDIDSLTDAELDALIRQGSRVVQHSVRKDETDLELAVNLAMDEGVNEILILACLGGRWDQTLANLMMLARPKLRKARLRILDGRQEVFLLRPGQTHRIDGRTGDTVSLIPIGGDARVTTTGLEYPLNNSVLAFGTTLGVSNQMNAPCYTVELCKGLLICVVIHNS